MARAALIVFATSGKPFDCNPTAPVYGGPPPTAAPAYGAPVAVLDAGIDAPTVSVAAYGAPAPPKPKASVEIGPIEPKK